MWLGPSNAILRTHPCGGARLVRPSFPPPPSTTGVSPAIFFFDNDLGYRFFLHPPPPDSPPSPTQLSTLRLQRAPYLNHRGQHESPFYLRFLTEPAWSSCCLFFSFPYFFSCALVPHLDRIGAPFGDRCVGESRSLALVDGQNSGLGLDRFVEAVAPLFLRPLTLDGAQPIKVC